MKRQKIKPSGINEVADSVTRSTTEAEDIDLAAERRTPRALNRSSDR